MYEKLARGHATAFISGLQEVDEILDWIASPRQMKAIDAFERSSFSKTPGRVLKRLSPLLRPQFRHLKVDEWTRQCKVVSASGLASTAENRVYRLPNDTKPLYSERAVFLVYLMLSQLNDEIRADVMTGSSISGHAIARLVERGGVSPATLSEDIFVILKCCVSFADQALKAAIDHSAKVSFMLPFKGGALVAVFMDMDPVHKREGYKTRRVLSVRTWLDEGKLSDLDRERMGDLDKMGNVLVHDYDAAKEHFLRWIKGNARPWQFSDITLGDQDYLPTEGPKIPAISS